MYLKRVQAIAAPLVDVDDALEELTEEAWVSVDWLPGPPIFRNLSDNERLTIAHLSSV